MTTSFRRIFGLLLGTAAGTGSLTCLAASPAKTATFDVTTYTVPEGFEMLAGATNHANFRRVDAGNWLLFGVYGSKASSGDLAAEFAADWKDLSGAPGVAAPGAKKRTVGAGVAAIEGGADCPGIGYVDLVDIDAGGKVVSIIIESGNADGFSKTYRKTIEAFLSGLVVKAAPAGAQVAAATPQTNARKGKTERVPDASYKKGGVPQGMFTGVSLLSGKAICLLFLSEGRVTRAIPSGSLDELDWAEHQSKNGGNCGTWSMEGETLTITWGMGGGVNTGVLKETADGVEFYGKRYARPAKAEASKLAGSWDSGRTVGAMTITSTLDIGADGSYHWVTESGGVVGGRAFANNSRDERGTMSISGRNATFHAADGTAKTYTLNIIAGTPLTAFSLENDMFTRR